MRSKLEVISNSWHRKYTSQPSITSLQPRNLIKLSHNKNAIEGYQLKTDHQQYAHDRQLPSKVKEMVKKLTSFIQKIEQTLKKILYQKEVKSYLVYAETSETEIMDNFSKSLGKFRQLLYQLKEKTHMEGSMHSSNEFSNSPSESHMNRFFQTKHQSRIAKKLNFDVLSFVLKYFEEHMIPETHWSTKDENKSNFFGSLLSKFTFTCGDRTDDAHQDSSVRNMQEVKLKQAMSLIVQEMNKEDLESLRRSGQSFSSQQKQNFEPKPIEETLKAILKIQELKPVQEMSSVQKIAYLFDLESKIFVSAQFIQSAAYFEDDITTLKRNKYEDVWAYVHQNDMGDKDTINLEYKIMKMLMIITNASVIRELEASTQQNSWFKKVVFGLSFPRYFFDYERAKLQNNKFLRKPNVQTTKSIWNLPENGLIKQLKKPLIFDAIKCNIEFYVPRTNSRNLKSFKNRIFQEGLDIFVPSQNSFKVRLLNFKELDIGNKNKYQQVFDTIVIHYHGGGFIALSSCTSQSYTRKWANALKMPVFSVDYGKPPEFRFPTPVLDCLDAYNFISTQIHKYFNIRPKRIFVAGDSAGGNLACALTGLTLKLQMQVPQGLLLAYPAVDTRTKFTPSRINSFNDIILYPTLLLLCMQEYLGNMENQQNPLASPILLTEDYVSDNRQERWPKKWPKTIVMVGKKDPLYDDSIRLCQRLADSNIEFHCEIYEKLSHAFLSIDKMLPVCAQTIQDSIKFFEKLISGEKIGVKKLL